MEIVNEKIGIKLGFEKAYKNQDENDFTFYKISAISTITGCASEECYAKTVQKHEIGDILSDFLFSDFLTDASQKLKEVNEVAVVDYICNRPQIIDNIAISISFSLTEDEKVMTMFGEANCQYKEMLDYSDISRDLHKYAREIPYNKVVEMSDYQITKYFVLCFLDTLQRCTLDCERENPFQEELEMMNIKGQMAREQGSIPCYPYHKKKEKNQI